MTDFASLGIKIDSSQVPKAVADLDKLAAAGGRAEAASAGLGKSSKAAAIEASGMAAAAQASAKAAVGQAAGFSTVTNAIHGNTIAMRESIVIGRELLSGNLTRLPGSLSILAQQFAITGQSASSFAKTLLQSFGILNVVQDAELAEASANAAASAAAVQGAAERAKSAIIEADASIELALAQKRAATTAAEATLAEEALAKAHRSAAAAAADQAIAEDALAVAQGRASKAAAENAAATVTRLGPLAGILIGVGVAATGAALGFQALKKNVADKGVLEDYARGLHLSAEQFDELKKKTNDFALTFGDVWNGIKKTYSDALDASPAWQKFKDGNESAFKAAIDKAINASAIIGGYFIGTYRTIVQTFSNLPSALGHAFVSAVNAAIDEINKLLKAATDGVNGFIASMNSVLHTNIAPLAPPKIGEIKDNYGKAGREAGKSFAQNVADATAEIQKNAQKGIDALWKNIIGAAEDRIKDEAGKPPKGKKPNDHGLAEALAELDAQIRGQQRLAEAYQISDVAAVKAEALQKAEEEAIKHKGEVGIFYEKELQLAVAKRAAEGGKVIADIHAEAAARSVVNDLVEQGIIPVQRMGQALEEQQKKRQLMAALAIAEEKGWKEEAAKLADEIKNLSFSQGVLNDELAKEAALRQVATNKDQIEQIKLETSLIGASNEVRAKQLALLEAEHFIRDNAIKDPKDQADVKDSYVAAAEAAVHLTEAQTNYNNQLTATADILALIDDRAQSVANVLSDAFGSFGEGAGQAITALSRFAAVQASLDAQHKKALIDAGKNEKAIALENMKYEMAVSNARLEGITSFIGGLKTMVGEHSKAYKALTAAEQAFAIIQAVNTIKNVAAGASKMFATLGPFAFPAVAAMLAVMAGLGFAGGGGSQSAPTSPGDQQSAAGTGSVLGDMKAQSQSIANSLKLVAENTNKDLQYSNGMLKALRNIDLGISKLAGTVAQQIQLSGSAFDTSKLKLGTSSSGGGILGFLTGGLLGGLLGGSTTTRSLYDQGIDLNGGTVGDIIANGISGDVYSIVEKIKKKKGFLGIGGSTKTTYSTTTGELDSGIADAVQGVIKSLRDGLVAAANVVGIQGAEAILNGFQVSIGRISFKDLTGEQIKDQLNAIFSKIGDDMAGALFPTLTTMQKVGEGLFETFIRVAKEYEAVDFALKSIGKEFGAVGVGSIQARDALVQLFGGLDEFISATDEFRSDFLTEAEQIAPVQASVIAELQRLGVSGVTTREQFKNLVLGLDLTTDAGRQMYASLLAVAPAFDKVLKYFDDLNSKAISGFQATIDQFGKFVDSLTKYRATLFATDAAQGNAYASLKAKFIATAGLAASGDATALGGLEGAGKDFLTAAKNNASSLQDYYRDVALVARGVDKGIFAAESTADYAQLQLDALQNATTILQQISTNTQATVAALSQPIPVAAPSTGAQPAETSNPVLEQQNETIIQQNATIISNLDEMRRFWRRVEGDGLTVKTDDDTPLSTVSA